MSYHDFCSKCQKPASFPAVVVNSSCVSIYQRLSSKGLYYLLFFNGKCTDFLFCFDFNFVFLRRTNSKESVTGCIGSIVFFMHRGTLQIKSKRKRWVCFRFRFTVRMVNTSVCVTSLEYIILRFSEVIYNWIKGCFMIIWNGIYRRQY